MKLKILGALCLWILSAVLDFGLVYADAHHGTTAPGSASAEYYLTDCGFDRLDHEYAMGTALMGPIWLIPVFVMSDFGRNGLRFQWYRPECR